MLALRKTRPGPGLDLVEAPEPPAPEADEITVAVEAVGICGSDVHAMAWTSSYGFMDAHLPLTLGHEVAGRVLRRGIAAPLSEGTRVAVVPTVTCGRCPACLCDRARDCARKATIGLTRDGGFAARLTLPARNCVALPDALDAELGALVEPLAVALDAVEVGEVGLGDAVLVLGPGPIGQGIALMARAAGAARVLVAGRASGARFAVLRALGFDALLDIAEGPLEAQVLRLTGGEPVDAVLEATGDPSSLLDGLGVLRRGGICVVVGIHDAPLNLPLARFVRMRHQLRTSHSTARPSWDRATALVTRDPGAFRPMITHRLPLARAMEGFERARSRTAGKVVLFPSQSQ